MFLTHVVKWDQTALEITPVQWESESAAWDSGGIVPTMQEEVGSCRPLAALKLSREDS